MKTDKDLRQQERPRIEPRRSSVWMPALVGLGVFTVVAVLVGLTAVALSRVDPIHGSGVPAPATPTTAPAAPTTPVLVTTGPSPDWPALVDSFLAYQDWLFTHPDPARMDDLFAPDYRVVSATGEVIDLAGSKADMEMLARGDLRFDTPPAPLTAAAVALQNRDATSASVFVRFNPRPGNRTVGRDGVVRQFPDERGAAVIWRLVLGPDGRWRLAGVKPA